MKMKKVGTDPRRQLDQQRRGLDRTNSSAKRLLREFHVNILIVGDAGKLGSHLRCTCLPVRTVCDC